MTRPVADAARAQDQDASSVGGGSAIGRPLATAGRRGTFAGAAVGLLLWALCAARLDHVPPVLPFYLSVCAFVFGSGAPVVGWLRLDESHVSRGERAALAAAIGLVLAPTLIAIAAVLHVGAVFRRSRLSSRVPLSCAGPADPRLPPPIAPTSSGAPDCRSVFSRSQPGRRLAG
jgi:hypothetical protein